MSSGSGGGGGGGGGGRGGGGGGGGGGLSLPIFDKLKKEQIGFGSPNSRVYIDLLDPNYENPNVKAVIVLFTDKEKGEKKILGQVFEEIANAVSKGSEEFKKKYEGIYFRYINIDAEKEKKGGGKLKLLDGIINLANNKRSLLSWFFNKPRWDPENKKVVEAEAAQKASTDQYKFTIDIDGVTKNKYPFILVYKGSFPVAFYEGPFGDINPKEKSKYPDDFKNQKEIVKEILDNFIREIAIKDEFSFQNENILDIVRKKQWKIFNEKLSKGPKEEVDIFNYFKVASRGYISLDNPKAVIPAIPSFIIPKITETTNMLGQKFNTENKENNDLIIFIPETIPVPANPKFNKENPTEEEKKKMQEEVKKYQEKLNEINKENEKLRMKEIYIPAIPSFYLDEKGKLVDIKRK